MRHTRRIALLALTLLVLTGCGAAGRNAHTTTAEVEQLTVSHDVKSAFMEAVADNGVRRWESTDVRVAWEGPQSSTDRRTLDDTISWLATIDGVPRLTVVSGEAEIVVHRAKRAEWPTLLGETEPHDSADGVTVTKWGPSGALKNATIVLDDTSAQHQRNRTIIHEIIHALGLGHHSCAGGLVYGGGDYSPVWEPTTFDTALVATLYNSALKPGEKPQDVASKLIGSMEGPACPAVLWQSVTVRDGVDGDLWCQVGADPRLCQRALGSHGPAIDAEVVAWLQQGTAYDHDPERFITFRLDGERVLCEKPAGAARTPCEQTNDNTIEVPTMWTDGVELYATPA
jgi:hypothetical protein